MMQKYMGEKNGDQLREFDAMMKVECQRVTEKYGENHSRHESLSVLEEEIYETEQELKRIKYAAAAGMLEMMQAGAMAKKFNQYMQQEG